MAGAAPTTRPTGSIRPKGLTVTYMTNIIPAGGLEDQAKIRALIYSALD